jgi:hypothetical protein
MSYTLQTATSPCVPTEWSTPSILKTGDVSAHVLRFPVVASDSSEAVVMGNDIVAYDGRPISSRPLSVWSLDGHDLGRPRGAFAFAFPRGILRNGVLYMLWAEPSAATRTSDPYSWPGTLSSIWEAHYSAGSKWSVPHKLFDGTIHAPMEDSPSVGARSDDALVEFGTTTQRDGTAVLAFRFVDEKWHEVLIPVGVGVVASEAFYPTIVENGQAIMVAFVDADVEGGGHDENSIFLVRSTDAGRTWSKRLRLSRSGRRPAFETQLHVDALHQTHLVWRRQDDSTHDVLGHMMSPDNGRAWTSAEETRLPGPAYRARSAIDHCGRVHVFYADLSKGQDKPRLSHATWNGAWHTDDQLFRRWEVGGLTVHRRADHALTVVFLGREVSRDPRGLELPFRTLVSHLPP